MGGDRPTGETAQVVNLRLARKKRARKARREAAAENAARHGQSRAARDLQKARAERARRLLDGHRLEPGGTDGPTDGAGE